jgi:hypothetical protein
MFYHVYLLHKNITFFFVMKTNQMHCLSSIYFITQPLHVLGIFTAHHQEVFTVYVQQLVCVIRSRWAGKLSRYSDWLQAGQSEDQIPVWARFSAPVQTSPGAHPDSCTMATGSFLRVESGQDMTLTP